MSQDAPPAAAGTRRGLFSSRWVVVSLFAIVVVGAVLGYRIWSRSPAAVPSVDLTGTDPEVAGAIRAAQEEVSRDPTSAEAWGQLGCALHAYSFHPEALVCYSRAEALDPNNAD